MTRQVRGRSSWSTTPTGTTASAPCSSPRRSLADRPTNNFGGIFCDRESARFRRAVLEGAGVLRIVLPPDAAALAASPELALETYVLWDLIHDRWHSHGDLPFDPFMIRQRLPYWMYSLEELRVDLATFGSAGELLRRGLRFRALRALRDPVRPHPALPHRRQSRSQLRWPRGQLLFAYLHQAGILRWGDNRLTIDWERLEEGVAALRERVEALYAAAST